MPTGIATGIATRRNRDRTYLTYGRRYLQDKTSSLTKATHARIRPQFPDPAPEATMTTHPNPLAWPYEICAHPGHPPLNAGEGRSDA